MIVEPDLIQHWKFRVLARAIGKAEAFQCLLGLWGYAQQRRQWIFRLDATTLGAICDSECENEKLWELMTHPRTGWLVACGGGWWQIRGWADMNRTLIQAWTSKSAGRLPWMAEFEKEVAVEERGDVVLPSPVSAPASASSKATKRETASAGESADTSYDPPKRREEMREDVSVEESTAHAPSLCTLEEATEHAWTLGIGTDAVHVWWHHRNAAGWTKGGGSSPSSKIHCWKSDLAISKAWAKERAEKGASKAKMMLRL